MSEITIPGVAGKAAQAADLLGAGLSGALSGAFAQMDWAEEEITAAQRRHPRHADRIWHAFRLLTPTHDLMATEFVYRGHCRELLERVAAGQDTRPGTAAEVCLACQAASQVAPLTTTAAGLYARMWAQAFPGHADMWAGQREHYEGIRAAQIDELEREARRKAAQAERALNGVTCKGQHHGEPVACVFAAAAGEVAA